MSMRLGLILRLELRLIWAETGAEDETEVEAEAARLRLGLRLVLEAKLRKSLV